eukprot:3150076-Amphidinium_carterae.1
MPPEWDSMVTRAIAYFRKRNIQCQDGTFMWHNLQWGTSKTGMARWHAASTDQNRSFMLQTIEAMYSFLMVSTGGNAATREKLRVIKESPEYTAASKKYDAFVREQHEQKKAMRNARRSGSMDPAVFFTKEELDAFKRLKKDVADFSWHLQVRCEEEAEKLAATRTAEALKLLMISTVE